MKTSRKKEWFDDETFWKEFYDFMFDEKRFVDAVEQVDKALNLTEPRGKSALDLCCGPGRCAVVLAQRRFRVTGVDKTKYLLGKARQRAKAAGVEVEWVQQDMRDFIRPDSFDLVISMFTSFGYFDKII